MSREDDELGRKQHDEQFAPEPGVDKQGYYPGQKDYEATHPESAHQLTDYKTLELWQEHLEAMEADPRLKVLGENNGLDKI